MNTKIIEIRDRSTKIIALASRTISANKVENDLLKKSLGFSEDSVLLTRFDPMNCNYDPYKWDQSYRTMTEAHKFIKENYDKIPSGWVVDVETILGETSTMKTPDRYYHDTEIKFSVSPLIEVGSYSNLVDWVAKNYNLDIRLEDLDIYITKDSISKLGLKFYEVLNNYLCII